MARQALFKQFPKDPDNFPVSINDCENGVLACTGCDPLFDDPLKHISIDKTGLLLFSAVALKTPKCKKLRDAKAKVAFAGLIGQKHYPTAKFIEWAAKQNKGEKKTAKTTLSFESEEKDDEDPPSPKGAGGKKRAAPKASSKEKAVSTKKAGTKRKTRANAAAAADDDEGEDAETKAPKKAKASAKKSTSASSAKKSTKLDD